MEGSHFYEKTKAVCRNISPEELGFNAFGITDKEAVKN